MACLIGGANSAADTGFEVANSCRFNDGDSASMSRDQSANSAGTTTKGTLSVWVKLSAVGTEQIIYERQTDTSNLFKIFLEDDNLRVAALTGGSYAMFYVTNRVFRDPSAWYHIVVRIDSTDATAGDRQQIWINGVRETSFSTSTSATEDASQQINTGTGNDYIGVRATGSNYFDGYMAEFVWIDGTSYPATSFGEFDEDSPTIWKPKDVSGLTFGTNGFYLDFEDSSNLGNDKNGGTDFTEANLAATDQSSDSPTNNFCTLNPLDNYYAGSTFSEGNCKVVTSGGNDTYNTSTFWLSAGKWYWEIKVGTTSTNDLIGIASSSTNSTSLHLGENTFGYGYRNGGAGDVRYNNGAVSGWSGTDYGNGDIIMVALDLTNSKLYFGVDGTWDNSGDPTSGSTGTGAVSIVAVGSTPNGVYSPAVSEWHNSNSFTYEANFGNPPYANSSDAADANGYGAFEYAPPSGYLALCTKNLGSDGG